MLGLVLVLLAGAPEGEPLTREGVIAAVRRIAAEGIEVDRALGAYNRLAAKFFARYPVLRVPAAAAGIPGRFESRDAFAAWALDILETGRLDRAGLSGRQKRELAALLARWCRRGRLSSAEAVEWQLTSGDGWRNVESPPGDDLAALAGRRREVQAARDRPGANGGGGGRDAAPRGPGGTTPSIRLIPTPELMRLALAIIEDFLAHYGEGPGEHAIAAASAEEMMKLLGAGLLPPAGERPASMAAASPDPAVRRGIDRLFRDLSRDLLGIDPAATARLVEALPDEGGWVIALGGYLSEAAGLPFHRLGTDYVQLAFGTRMRVRWLGGRGDLEELILDPSVRRLILAGHGTMGSYHYAGLTGPPEETLARALAWARARDDLAPELAHAAATGDPWGLVSCLRKEAGLAYETWEHDDFAALAAREGFRRKERMVLYACSVDEVRVRPGGPAFGAALRAELARHRDAGAWLGFTDHGSSISFEPLTPAAAARFRGGLPGLLGAVRRRLGEPFRTEAAPDFLELLAEKRGRFPGNSWGHDFALAPEGLVWSTADLVREIEDPSSSFFAGETVHDFKIAIDEAGVASLRADRRADVRATVTVDGTVYSDVAIHVKGGPGSLRNLDDKPSLTLSFSRFHRGRKLFGMPKVHLNNSTQDPSYLNELLTGELFRAADVPAPRAAHAVVELNGRKRGLYVLKEGFSKDFLRRYFKDPRGNLYDPGPAPSKANDVGQPMERKSGRGPEDWSDLKAIAAATQEPDPDRRWQRLERLLDMERVLSFMALEVMACHIDGYCLSVANYRIYHDLDRDKVLLFPHGMDQMLGGDFAGHVLHQMPVEPNMRGAIAQAILRTPEGRRRYLARCGRLLGDVFKVEALTGRLDEVAARLRPVLLAEGAKAAASFDAAVAMKRDQIIRRAASLAGQIQGSRSPRFEDGTARLTVWTTWDDRRDARLEEDADGGRRTLTISAQRVVSASWRARVMLAAGRYRFEGLARTAGVIAAPEKGEQGAGLRVSGVSAPASRRVAHDGPWQKLGCDFEVTSPSAEVDLICELRADRGGAAFDRDSLRLVRLEPSGAGEF